ncbi:MAG TPA: type III polyketide synthase [Xanthobacteraceae bacterium]|nr:type III polyketide synthase [Xanthobacteraceae bacterium]
MREVSILSLATATPSNVVEQSKVVALAPDVFPELFSRYPVMLDIFGNSGIERRRTVRPLEWYLEPRDWKDRSKVFHEEGLALFESVAKAAIERAQIDPEEIDCVVTVCSSGIATPTLEARAAESIGLRDDVRRVPVFGLGCAGGVSGLALASRLASAEADTTVLVVVVELCSLAFRIDRGTKEDAVASALFADGAAAVVLRANGDAGLAQVRGSAEHIWPDTLDVMGWTFDPIGFGVVLSRSVPIFVERRFPPVAKKLLAAAGLKSGEVGRYICHPGGGKVVDAVEMALKLKRGSLDHERDVLREFGNMSAPTVLFALERVLRAPVKGALALSALGPGFTASLVALDPARA